MSTNQYKDLLRYALSSIKYHTGGKETLREYSAGDIVGEITLQMYEEGECYPLYQIKKKINSFIVNKVHNIHIETHENNNKFKESGNQFIDSYQEIYRYVIGALKNLGSRISADDVINEVYIKTYKDGFDIRQYKKEITKEIQIQKRLYDGFVSMNHIGVRPVEDSKVCNCCNEIWPVSCFRIINDNRMLTYYQINKCKFCERKDRVGKPCSRDKIKQREYRKKYESKNRETINQNKRKSYQKNSHNQREKMKEYMKRQIDGLTDVYIKQLIRNKSKIKTHEITSDMIENKRQELINKKTHVKT